MATRHAQTDRGGSSFREVLGSFLTLVCGLAFVAFTIYMLGFFLLWTLLLAFGVPLTIFYVAFVWVLGRSFAEAVGATIAGDQSVEPDILPSERGTFKDISAVRWRGWGWWLGRETGAVMMSVLLAVSLGAF